MKEEAHRWYRPSQWMRNHGGARSGQIGHKVEDSPRWRTSRLERRCDEGGGTSVVQAKPVEEEPQGCQVWSESGAGGRRGVTRMARAWALSGSIERKVGLIPK
jgi:hypothetical protein